RAPADRSAPGEGPTRLHRLDEVLEPSAHAPPGRTDPEAKEAEQAAVPADPQATRLMSPGVRRFALLGLLACSFLLMLRAHRVHPPRHAASPDVSPVPTSAVSAPPASSSGMSSAVRTAEAPAPSDDKPAASAPASARRASATKARLAAD